MTVAEKVCKHCAAGVDASDRFCRECGTRQVQYSNKFSSVLLEQRRRDETANPLLKAELVLTIALSTFVLSALVWARSGTQFISTPKKKIAQVAVKPRSEIDRLFAEAKTAPAAVAAIPAKPVVVETKKEVKPVLLTTPITIPATTTRKVAAPTPNPLHDDVAEYNQKLAEFFARKSDDTAGGAADVEPPSFEEWQKAGKPNF